MFYNDNFIFSANSKLIPETSAISSTLASFIFATLPNLFSNSFFFASPIPSMLSKSDFVISLSLKDL